MAVDQPEAQHLFLSYCRSEPDGDFALRLANDLRVAGHRVWLDVEGLEGGTAWNEEIQQALDACYAYVVVLSPEALESRWVRNELLYALQHRAGLVFPVMLRECKLPVELVAVQYVDFQGEYRGALARLLSALPTSPWDPAATAPAMRSPAYAPPRPTGRHPRYSEKRSFRLALGKGSAGCADAGRLDRAGRAAHITACGERSTTGAGGQLRADPPLGRAIFFALAALVAFLIPIMGWTDLGNLSEATLSPAILILLPLGVLWTLIDAVRGKAV
jgi:hypothetical protein